MNKIHIVTDSTSDLTSKMIEEYEVSIIPIQVIFRDTVFKDKEDITIDDLFSQVPETDDFPKTSQPPVGDFITLFEKILNEGQEILGIFLAEELSGTIMSARLAAQSLEKEKITIIDSRQVHMGLGLQVIRACELVEEGLDRSEIKAQIKKLQQRINVLVWLDTLDYLFRGGRLNRLEAGLGSLLNIKPLVEVVEGKVKALAKVRGKKRRNQLFVREIQKRTKPGKLIRVAIGEAWAFEQAQQLKKQIENKFNCVMLDIVKTGIGLGAHVGPGVLAVSFYEV